jgi:hypothetical protein
MASYYEKLPHFILERAWDEKTQLPETYKLHSNDSCNKIKAEVHQDSGKLGVEFTVKKTIPNFNKGAKKINLDFSHSFVEFENVRLPGSRSCTSTFRSRPTRRMYPPSKIAQERRTFAVPWSFSSSKLTMSQSHKTGSTST